jgi:chromosome segregation ATPase
MPEEPTQPQEQVKFNQDGSVDLPIDGKPIRFVKEADLLAVKGGVTSKETAWETEKAQFNTQLAEANRLREETHQTLLQTQAERDNLKEQYKDHDTYKTRVGELETELGSHKERLTSYEGMLVERMRQALVGAGASEESLKDKTLDQLRSLEEAAKVFGREVKPQPANYDGGKQGGGSAPETPLDRAKRILEEHEAAGRRIGSRNTPVKVG